MHISESYFLKIFHTVGGECPSHTVPVLGRNARPHARFTRIMPPPPPTFKVAPKPMHVSEKVLSESILHISLISISD